MKVKGIGARCDRLPARLAVDQDRHSAVAAWDRRLAVPLHARRSTKTDAATGDADRPRVLTMRSAPRVVDLPDATSESDADFDDQWPKIDLEPADFVVPPPAPETADTATCTPPLPEPELARRTATAMADRPHLHIDQLQDQILRDIRDTPLSPPGRTNHFGGRGNGRPYGVSYVP